MSYPDDDILELPIFDRPKQDPPGMTYEQAVIASEEIIQAYDLREENRPVENIPEFKM